MPDEASQRAQPAPTRPPPKGRRAKPAAISPGDVAALAAKLGVQPRRPALLRQALIHKSAEQELNVPANERLEFLGDAVLDLVLAEHLFRTHPDLAEGDLTKVKAVAVSEPVLAEVARELGVGLFLLLARGKSRAEGATGARSSPTRWRRSSPRSISTAACGPPVISCCGCSGAGCA